MSRVPPTCESRLQDAETGQCRQARLDPRRRIRWRRMGEGLDHEVRERGTKGAKRGSPLVTFAGLREVRGPGG